MNKLIILTASLLIGSICGDITLAIGDSSGTQQERAAVGNDNSASAASDLQCFNRYAVDVPSLRADGVKLISEKLADGSEKAIGITLVKTSADKVWGWVTNWELISEKVNGVDYYKTIYTDRKGEAMQWFSIIEAKLNLPLWDIYYYLLVDFDQQKGTTRWGIVDEAAQKKFQAQGVKFGPPTTDRIKAISGESALQVISAQETVYCYAPSIEFNGYMPGIIRRFLLDSMLRGFLETLKQDLEGQAKQA